MKNKTYQFCQYILQLGVRHARALVNLVIALSSHKSQSVVDLSTSPLYQYQYTSITDAITHLASTPEELLEIEHKIVKQVSHTYWQDQENHIVFQTDKTSVVKPHSKCMSGRHMVPIPNQKVPGNQSINIGVEFSFVNIYSCPGNWSLPISARCVELNQTGSEVAVIQISDLLTDKAFAFHDKDLVVNTLDSGYATATYIDGVKSIPNLVSIIRFRHGSKVYVSAKAAEEIETKASKKVFGQKYYLIAQSDIKHYKSHPKTKLPYDVERIAITEKTPEEDILIDRTLSNGRQTKVHLRAWHGLIVRTKNGIKMEDKPFTMVCAQVWDAHSGEQIFKRPLFLAIFGQKREELSAEQIYDDYGKRYGIEPFFRFTKRNLHFQDYQANSSQNFNNYVIIILLSVWLLFTATDQATNQPEKWQKYKDIEKNAKKGGILTISQVYKAMCSYLSTLDLTDFAPPKSKAGPGRVKGYSLGKREEQPYSKKKTSATKKTGEKKAKARPPPN